MLTLLLGLAWLIPVMAIVAAWIGYSALTETPVNAARLKLSFALLVAPWVPLLPAIAIEAVRYGIDIDGLADLGMFVLSPVVGVALAAGWAARRLGGGAAPSPEYLALMRRREGERIATAPAARPERTNGTVADLHLPAPAITAATIGVLLFLGWTMATPENGRDAGPLAAELLGIAGTMLVSGAAILCWMVFSSRPSPGVAVVYSGLSLMVIAGVLFILIQGYWRDGYNGLYPVTGSYDGNPYAIAAMVLGTIAAAPAVIGELAWRLRR